MVEPSWKFSQAAVSGQRMGLGRLASYSLACEVQTLTNPATGATTDLKDATATVAAIVTWTAADLKAAGKTKLAAHGARKLVFTTAGVTPADAPANVVITGTDIGGSPLTETLALSQIAGAATSVKCYATIVSLVFPAADGVNATIALGMNDTFGLSAKAATRESGAVAALIERLDGSIVGTGGAAATATNQTQSTGLTVDSSTATVTNANGNAAVTNANGNAAVTNANGNAAVTNAGTAVKIAGHFSVLNPLIADLIYIVADIQIADGVQVIAHQPDCPRELQVRITDAVPSITGGTVTIIGTGAGGAPLAQIIPLVGGTRTVVTDGAYATVTSITVAGLVGGGAGINIGVGQGAALGVPVPADATGFAVHKTMVDQVDEAVAGVDPTSYSIAPTTAANGAHDYAFCYSYDLATHTHVATDAGHTHVATDAGHTHVATDAGHTHVATDAGHVHATTEVAHNHTQNSHTHAGAEGEGTFETPTTSPPNGNWTPAVAPNGAHDYCIIYEVDVT